MSFAGQAYGRKGKRYEKCCAQESSRDDRKTPVHRHDANCPWRDGTLA
jgi:hypothetical protein